MRNVLVVISGPSGVGKGTIAKQLVNKNENLALSISCTTRQPRNNEINAREYFFISKDEFLDKIKKDGFLEYSEHFDNFYGTPKDFVLDSLKDHDVILEIDVNGGLKVKESFPSAVLVMVTPPSKEELFNRLVNRNTESIDKIKFRMERIDYELEKSKLYDYVVINDDLSVAIEEIKKIINQEKQN